MKSVKSDARVLEVGGSEESTLPLPDDELLNGVLEPVVYGMSDVSEDTSDDAYDDDAYDDDAPEDALEIDAENKVKIETLAKDFENAVAKNPIWSTKYAIIDSAKHANPIAFVLLQVDKTPRNRLTVQQIMVKGPFRRQGVAKRILNELKKASVRTGRVAHVQSATGDGMEQLLMSNGFSTVEYTPFDYVWEWNAKKPLSWDNWHVDLSWTGHHGVLTEEEVSQVYPGIVDLTKQLSVHAVFRGMDVFHDNAMWFKPETNLRVISQRLGHSVRMLGRYREARQCFNQSYLYSMVDERCFTIHGWGVDVASKFPTGHACLCAVLEDGLFVFDLVRDTPLVLYGVPVRRDFMERIENIGSHGGLYAVDTMNFLQQRMLAHDTEDMNELLDILREAEKSRSEEKKKRLRSD